MNTNSLFQPLVSKGLKFENRIAMAPMTRSRSDNDENAATELTAKYYRQRATAGLIISEGTYINKEAVGYINVPAIYSEAQINGWKIVTKAVHEEGSVIYAQLWHVGAMSHPDFHEGRKPLAPSDYNPNSQVFTPEGFKQSVAPQPMTAEDIQKTIQDFKKAAINAFEAGFDGVELHAANGYLLQQFFSKNSNSRTDEYGGSVENRARILFDILDELKTVVDLNKVGVRLNPSLHQLMGIDVDGETIELYNYIVQRLNDYDLAYLHLIEPFTDVSGNENAIQEVAQHFRAIYKGIIIINRGFTKETAAKVIEDGDADLVKPVLNDMELLADCYLKMKNYELAENWYSKFSSQPNSKPENLIKYGEVLKANMKYNEAKQIFLQYVKSSGDQSKVAIEIAGCDSALKWISTPTTHQIKNEATINTQLSEFSVFPTQSGVFYVGEPDITHLKDTYARTGNPYLRIYTANRSKNELNNGAIDLSGFNNGKYHIGPVSANKDGSVLYITRNTANKELELNKVDRVQYETNNLELYLFKKNNDKWEEFAFPYNNVQKYSVGHASLSNDNKLLYFVSNMPGGFGGTDIWYCELQGDGTWGKPQNAGAQINTSKDEMFPYAGESGNLYFSSNGWPGMGGLDIFVAKGSKQNWTNATNLKYPVNSSTDDFGFIVFPSADDVINGYLSSNRKGGKGADDIYGFTFKKPITKIILAVKGHVVDRKTGKPISGANVALSTLTNQSPVISKNVKSDGVFLFELAKETDYNLAATKEKFEPDTKLISTKGITKSDTLVVDLKLSTIFEIGRVFTLKNINYDFDKDNIRPDAAKILDGLVITMKENPTLEIELGSHTDSRGADKYNLALSQRRAQSVVNYLVTKGISRARMIAKGYGETQLLNECENGVSCTEDQHQENRRTVFKVLKY